MKACTSCGATRVTREVVMSDEPGRELVIVTCAGCGNRRNSYTRRKR